MRVINLAAPVLFSANLVTGCAFIQWVMPSTMSDANIVSLFDTMDKNEIAWAQLAKQKASSPLVRDYADRLMREHTALLIKKDILADRLHLRPNKPSLASSFERANRDRLEALRKTSGPDFDRTYIDQQITIHNEAIQIARDTAESVHDSRLQQELVECHAELAAHAGKARSIRQQLAGHPFVRPHP